MDKDDPFRHGANPGSNQGNENDFDDDARYDDAVTPSVREEEYAAGQEEWDQPIDELAEDDQQLEAEPAPKRDPFADEGPLEDEYVEHEHHAGDHDDGDQHHEEGHEQEHDLEHDPDVDGPQQAAPSKASPLAGMKAPEGLMKQLPLIGGGIAALVIAFFGYQQFFGGEQAATTPSLENQNTWDLQPGHSSTQHASNEFQQPAPQPTPAPQPDATNTQPSQPTTMITPVATPVVDPAPQQQAPLPVAAAPNPLEGRIAELTAQLEQMKQTQDQLNQKLAAATATPPSMDENSKAATQALNDRIAQLEQKLAAQPAPAPVSQTVDAPTKSSTKATRMVDQDQPASTPRKSKRGSTDFMAVKKSKAAKKRRAEPADDGFEPVASRSSFQGWILRSAQPGSAWLSQGPYSSDLRRVVPGDKVQGLGTVTSIHQIAGRWVVEGTQGAVR
ncbi:MAG: hypothetical protein SFW65_03115 [Alphaproteobacteria bacterium]|nr:hypothetical protein [Alphaproteobacteria bacterium]